MSSLIQGSHIFIGGWIDWSKGAVLGSTITLPPRSGAVLTAFLAFFVTIVGACLWRIVCFIIHQLSATSEARDGIHHQHQLILRNTSSPSSAAMGFSELAFSWRKNGKRAWSRSLPLAGFAVLFMLGFGAASLLTSLVTKSAGSARLVVSDRCGLWAMDDSGAQSLSAMLIKDTGDTLSAAQYSRSCYNDDTQTQSTHCNIFAKKALTYTTDTNGDCPFGDGICNGTSIIIDTQRLNSQADFGINTPKSGRIDFRKVTTCAPLQQDGYVRVTNATGTNGFGAKGDTIRHFSYGAWAGAPGLPDDTWLYNQHAFVDNFGYQLNAILHRADQGTGAWQPIPALERSDADVTIMFLAPNAIQFTAPNDDPFFHANFEVPLDVNGLDQTYWLSDNWVNVMACTDQYQFCNPLTSTSAANACTPLSGYYPTLSAMIDSSDPVAKNLGLNPLQSTIATVLSFALRSTSVYHSISNRGASALVAQESVNDLAQTTLAPNQWHVEVTAWFTTSLAKLQRTVTSYAAGPEHVAPGAHILSPPSHPRTLDDTLLAALCHAQKVNVPNDTVSFSALGVATILALGALVVAVYFALEPAVGYLQRRWGWFGAHRRLRWLMDENRQVQRMAFEEAGMGRWKNLTGLVPVTEPGDVFGGLGHVDPQRPRLGEKWTQQDAGAGAGASKRHFNVEVEEASGSGSGSGRVTPIPPYPREEEKAGASPYQKPVYQALPSRE